MSGVICLNQRKRHNIALFQVQAQAQARAQAQAVAQARQQAAAFAQAAAFQQALQQPQEQQQFNGTELVMLYSYQVRNKADLN